MKRYWRYLLPAVVATSIGVWFVAWSGRGIVHSETKTSFPGIPEPQEVHAEATLICQEGAEVTLGSQLAGQLKRVYVKEGQTVHAGELLAELETSEQQAQLAEASARVMESTVDEKFESTNYQRMKLLSQHGTVSREQFDQAAHEADRAAAEIQVNQAVATRLAAQLRKSRIVAPFDGVVLQRLVNDQEEVVVGTPILRLADLQRTWVEAQVDELDATRIRIGAHAQVAIEGYPDQTWGGQVVYIPAEMTRRTEISADPTEPTRSQVLRVRIALSKSAPLKLKQRLEVAIDTSTDTVATTGGIQPLVTPQDSK